MGRRRETRNRRRTRLALASATAAIVAAAGGLGITVSGAAPGAEAAPAGVQASAPIECSDGERVVRTAVPVHGGTATCIPVSQAIDGATRVDPLYSSVATGVVREAAALIADAVEREVTVVCWSSEDWTRIADLFEAQGNPSIRTVFGFVSMPDEVVNLSPHTCKGIDEIVYEGTRPETMSASAAIGTITHEAIHVAGVADEGQTECAAVQLLERTSVELGMSQPYGETLAALQSELNHTSRAGSVYDSPECAAGGEFDLGTGSL